MALDTIAQLSPEETALEILNQLGAIGKWLQAIGIIFLLWLIFQVTNFIINGKRISKLNSIENRLETLDKKLNKLSGTKSSR